jgi:CBS domain-containing protein
MNAGALCNRNVVTVGKDDDLVTAAKLMRERHVGYLIVTMQRPDGGAEPVGVLTDRDIVVSVVAREVDPRSLKVADVMTRQPVTIGPGDSIDETVARMRQFGVRRMPVIDSLQRLVGVVALDDVLDHTCSQLASITASIRNEQRIERELRP